MQAELANADHDPTEHDVQGSIAARPTPCMPAGQILLQSVIFVLPVPSVDVRRGHFEHELAPVEFEKEPWGQEVHGIAPDIPKLPGVQRAVQLFFDTAPGARVVVDGGHTLHF